MCTVPVGSEIKVFTAFAHNNVVVGRNPQLVESEQFVNETSVTFFLATGQDFVFPAQPGPVEVSNVDRIILATCAFATLLSEAYQNVRRDVPPSGIAGIAAFAEGAFSVVSGATTSTAPVEIQTISLITPIDALLATAEKVANDTSTETSAVAAEEGSSPPTTEEHLEHLEHLILYLRLTIRKYLAMWFLQNERSDINTLKKLMFFYIKILKKNSTQDKNKYKKHAADTINISKWIGNDEKTAMGEAEGMENSDVTPSMINQLKTQFSSNKATLLSSINDEIKNIAHIYELLELEFLVYSNSVPDSFLNEITKPKMQTEIKFTDTCSETRGMDGGRRRRPHHYTLSTKRTTPLLSSATRYREHGKRHRGSQKQKPKQVPLRARKHATKRT